MKTIPFLTLLMICLLFAFNAHALESGIDAPELKLSKWIMNGPVKIEFDKKDVNADKKVFAVEFWGTWSSASRNAVPLLVYLQKKFRDKGLKVIAVTREDESAVNKFIESNPNINYGVVLDEKSVSTLTYMGESRLFPKVFLIGNGNKIMWSGEVIDLPWVLDKFYAGRFDQSKQREISKLSQEIQVALLESKNDTVRSLAQRVLEIDPEDGFAMRTVMFAYESDEKADEAISFLSKMITENPKLFRIYFVKLDFITRYPAFSKELLPLSEAFITNFPDNPEELNNLAWMLVERFPYFPGTLELAWKAVGKAYAAVEKNGTDEQKSACLNTMALIYYKCGMLPQAIDAQKKVSALLKDNAAVQKNSSIALDYYERALKLQQQIKPQPVKPQPAVKPAKPVKPQTAAAQAKPQQPAKPVTQTANPQAVKTPQQTNPTQTVANPQPAK